MQICTATMSLLSRAGDAEAKLLKVAEHSPKPECSGALAEETNELAIVLRAKGRTPTLWTARWPPPGTNTARRCTPS